MLSNLFRGIFFPVLWLALLSYAPDVWYLHTALRWIAATLMVSYFYTIPKFAPHYNFDKYTSMKIALRIWVVVALFALIWGHIVPVVAALIFITSVACSTVLGVVGYRISTYGDVKPKPLKAGLSEEEVSFAIKLAVKNYRDKHFTPSAMRVLKERLRQTDFLGHTPEKDAIYTNYELVKAAMCYAEYSNGNLMKNHRNVPISWPWDDEYWKPGTYQRNLEKAAALLLAEMDRTDETD